jgi:hypothetical protein
MTDDQLTPTPRPLPSRRSSGIPRMAKPVARATELAEAPVVEPAEHTDEEVRESAPQTELALEEAWEPEASVEAVPAVEPEPPVAEPLPEPEPDALADQAPEFETQSEPLPPSEPVKAVRRPDPDLPRTVRETLLRVDDAWRSFQAAAARFPAERMDERLTEHGWTVKQMLAHIAAWHDVTADRMIKFINTGQTPEFDQDVDVLNAMVARRAVGKTAGEILNDTDATFNRLRRQMQRLTDPQLNANDAWAAWVIRGNTYGHYDEHRSDIQTPAAMSGNRRR